MILEVEPLTDPDVRRVPGEMFGCELRRSVLAQKTHIEMPVIGRAFCLAVPCCGRPCTRQIIQTVPVDPRNVADQQISSPLNTPLLHLLSTEGGNSDF